VHSMTSDTRPGPRRVASGSPFESRYQFCRAIRIGDRVEVAGTAPIWPDDEVDPDPRAQARRCFAIVGEALAELGAGFGDVVRTRMFITDLAVADAVGSVHGEVFVDGPPPATMVVVAGLLDPRWVVEIEVEAQL